MSAGVSLEFMEASLLQRVIHQLNVDFAEAPIFWILLGLYIMAQLGSWQAGGDLDRVCALTNDRDIEAAAPVAVKDEIDHICLNHRAEH
jgi:hypothetical protein